MREGERLQNRWIGALAVTTLLLVGAGCTNGDQDPEVAPRREANLFLDHIERAQITKVCEQFTYELLVRLAPPNGGCNQAISVMAQYTETEDAATGTASSLTTKKVGDVEVDGDVAIVTLTDKISGGNELPLRLVRTDDVWKIDEIGIGATITKDCIAERKQVEDAVERFLSNNDNYPDSTKALVPSYLDQLPKNHEVTDSGKVKATGPCA